MADIDNDGRPEIVVGSGFPIANKGYWVKAWDYTPNSDPTKALTLKWTGATSGQVFTSPAIGDLNKDGTLDVVAISSFGGPCGGQRVYAWKGAKWVKEITFSDRDEKGFWEVRGYSNTALPWQNDRYG